MDARPARWLVLGYGNALRGDDGAGPAAAEAIQALKLPGVEVLVCHQLLPEQALALAGVDRVVFFDALADPASTVLFESVEPGSGPEWTGHFGSPGALLSLTRAIYGVCPRAWMVGIPAERFGWEIGLSEQARAGIAAAVERVRTLVLSEARVGVDEARTFPAGMVEAAACTRLD